MQIMYKKVAFGDILKSRATASKLPVKIDTSITTGA